ALFSLRSLITDSTDFIASPTFESISLERHTSTELATANRTRCTLSPLASFLECLLTEGSYFARCLFERIEIPPSFGVHSVDRKRCLLERCRISIRADQHVVGNAFFDNPLVLAHIPIGHIPNKHVQLHVLGLARFQGHASE